MVWKACFIWTKEPFREWNSWLFCLKVKQSCIYSWLHFNLFTKVCKDDFSLKVAEIKNCLQMLQRRIVFESVPKIEKYPPFDQKKLEEHLKISPGGKCFRLLIKRSCSCENLTAKVNCHSQESKQTTCPYNAQASLKNEFASPAKVAANVESNARRNIMEHKWQKLEFLIQTWKMKTYIFTVNLFIYKLMTRRKISKSYSREDFRRAQVPWQPVLTWWVCKYIHVSLLTTMRATWSYSRLINMLHAISALGW